MKTRLDYGRVAPGAYDAMHALERLAIAGQLQPGTYQPAARRA